MESLTASVALTAAAIGEMTKVLDRPPTPAELSYELDMPRGELAVHLAELTEQGWLPPAEGDGRRKLTLLHEPPAPPDEFAVEPTDLGRDFLRLASYA